MDILKKQLIDSTPGAGSTTATKGKSAAGSAGKTESTSNTEPAGTELTLSSSSSALSEVPFDKAKVESVKQNIKNGEYQINAGAIADGLLKDVKALLGGK